MDKWIVDDLFAQCQYAWQEVVSVEPETDLWDFILAMVQMGYLKDVWLFAHWAHNAPGLSRPLGNTRNQKRKTG